MDNFEKVENVCEDSSQNQSKSNMSHENDTFNSQSVTELDSTFDSSLDLDIVVKVYSELSSSNESEQENVLKLYRGPVAFSTPNLSPQVSDETNENIETVDKHFVKESCINAMFAKECCVNNCIKIISRDITEKYRETFQQYSAKEQELMIKAHLVCSRQNFKFLNYYKSKRTNNEETDIYQHKTFYFRQIPICKKLYLFLHDLEYTKYDQIVAQFDKCELAPHELAGK